MKENNIAYYRRISNISQLALSKMTKIPQTTISGWENGIGEPAVTRAMILAKILNADIYDLFAFDKNATNQ